MEYKLSKREYLKYISIGVAIVAVFSYLFYRSLIAFIILLPGILLFLKIIKKNLAAKKAYLLNLQFKDAILSISASLNTGYSIENSVKESYKEMLLLYGEESLICHELRNMIRQISINVQIEKVFEDFALRTGIEDIEIFASVLQIGKRGGGDLMSIIKNTATNISEKVDLKREINSLISSKKYEQSIMNLIPLFIIVYVDFTSPGLISKLYGNVFGIIVMTICLIFYIGAYLLSSKITKIQV